MRARTILVIGLWSLGVLVVGDLAVVSYSIAADEVARAVTVTAGRELFLREWIPGDKRSHGGDGLGPVFNDSSCVGCHNQGGVGGGGSGSKNVDIVTAFRKTNSRPGTPLRTSKTARREDDNFLFRLHPGFMASANVVLHRHGAFAEYNDWRTQLMQPSARPKPSSLSELALFNSESATVVERSDNAEQEDDSEETTTTKPTSQRPPQSPSGWGSSSVLRGSATHGNWILVRSQRNTPALFGGGLIDSIPVAALVDLERQQAERGEVSGRVARLRDGRAGRFGWKAQTSTLKEFVLAACAVELGLNVPGHSQALVAQKSLYESKGFDLNEDECSSMAAFVRSLPAPQQRPFAEHTERAYVDAGEKLFQSIGCAACHVPQVGEVQGIYSDLLVHDMGPSLSDSAGGYGTQVGQPHSPKTAEPVQFEDFDQVENVSTESTPKDLKSKPIIGATRVEWRTPPLWGIRDSAPYLHDGRASTLEEAIAGHGGESVKSAKRFQTLTPAERFQLVTFLKSLVAPDQLASARDH